MPCTGSLRRDFARMDALLVAFTRLLSALVLTLLLVSCALGPAPSPVTSSPEEVVTLHPGDEIELKFYHTPELNELQRVRPDGKIVAHLVGEVDVGGLTPDQVRQDLLEKYTPHLVNPEIAVFVRETVGRKVFVSGQVRVPGHVDMPGRLSVLSAVSLAGGFDFREAEVHNVVVIRHEGNQRYGYSLNLAPTLRGEETEPFYLKPQDIVYVPRTRIAKINQFVDQHISGLVPQTGFQYSVPMGAGTIGIDTSSRR